MNIYDLTNYVNLDVDDVYEVEDIAKWFNKGIANYNLIPPLTQYPTIDLTEDGYNATLEPADSNFLLGIMLPFINNAIMGQDAAIDEKQLYMQEFMINAREYKKVYPIASARLVDNVNTDLDNYRIGQNVFVSDMRYSPMQGEWSQRSNYYSVKYEEEENPNAWSDIEGEDLDG